MSYTSWLTLASYDEGFVLALLDDVLPLSSMGDTGITTEEAIHEPV